MDLNQNINESSDFVSFPSFGVGEFSGLTAISPISVTKKIALNAGSSSSSASSPSYLRINSYSSCKLSNNTALIAISSQDNVDTLPLTTDNEEIDRRLASRVFIVSAPLENYYAPCERLANVVAINQESSPDCVAGSLDIKINVGDEIWGDTNLEYIWALDGDISGVKFKITNRISSNIWRILPVNSSSLDIPVGSCFKFVAYGINKYKYPNSLNFISPLPYIEVNGKIISAFNPQIATNPFLPANENPYVYVVAEAIVDGVSQLFFYSFKIADSYEIYGWKQLTFNGENKNAKIKVDKNKNLQITWESSRCKPSQIFYGIIGPSSREISNETVMSVLEKQKNLSLDTNDLSTSLLNVGNPTNLDLRPIDEYGVYQGMSQWDTTETSGGSVSVIAEDTITATGNPSTQKFAATAILTRDENNEYFDGLFSQLSYQISFSLNLQAASITDYLTEDDIANEFSLFKQTFTPSSQGATENINVYYKNGELYTINNIEISYDGIIPFVGSYKPYINQQIELKHYMIAAIPEKVKFIAKSHSGSSDIIEEYYTGYFKLGIVFETSANSEFKELGRQKSHWIKTFGDKIKFNESHSYKIAVHYSHLREEGIKGRTNDLLFQSEQNVRFSGDIIVLVDNNLQLSDYFIPDFSEGADSFNIGFGCLTVGEFKELILNPFIGSTNENINVSFNFSGISIGPHSVLLNENIISIAKTDRNVSQMIVPSLANEFESMSANEESFNSQDIYSLTFGLNRQKFSLSQIPITFSKRNTSPSIDIDKCSKPHIAYQSNRDGNWEIYYTAVCESGIFKFDTKITDYDGDSLSPSIAIGSNKRLITWHDNRTGVYQIYAAKSTEEFGCIEESCEIKEITDLGTESIETGLKYTDEYDPYIEDPYYGNICQISFTFKNEFLTTKKYKFRANFYFDDKFTSFYKDVDSYNDSYNWFANNEKIDSSGLELGPEQSAEVVYYISKEDFLSGQTYYVEFEADDGVIISPLEQTAIYFCPFYQAPKCNIPIVYTNNEGSQINTHFRITVFADEYMQKAVLVKSTEQNNFRWSSGSSEFPTTGLTIDSGDTVSVSYNPEFASIDETSSSLLRCGIKYWVQIEAKSEVASVWGDYSLIDSYMIECSCENNKIKNTNTDTQSYLWRSSGQGYQDIRITKTNSHALFSQISAAGDGAFYIAWEDMRFSENDNNHYVYCGLWDSRNDIFYCSAQGFNDKEIAIYNKFKPCVIANNMQHASFIFSDGNHIYTRSLSLYKAVQTSLSSSSSSFGMQGVYNENVIENLGHCTSVNVYKENVSYYIYKNSTTPIPLVDNYKIKLEISGPTDSYSVRFKNENDSEWSEWLDILPKLPNYPLSSSSANSDRGYLSGYFIDNGKFIIPWVLSSGNGDKRVYCQIMTHSGLTPPFYTDMVAYYKELKYRVEFYLDRNLTIPASKYNNIPVVSKNVVTVDKNTVKSIEASAQTTDIVYVKVSFDSLKDLENLLDISNMNKFVNQDLSFDVYTSGYNSFKKNLTKIQNGVYTGSFTVLASDGVENIDGPAVVKINLPEPYSKPSFSSSTSCIGKITTPDDIKIEQKKEIENFLNYDKFKFLYNKDVLCSFSPASCVFNEIEYSESLDDDSEPAVFNGPVECKKVSWISPPIGEKYFYLLNGGNNANDWTITSKVFELDFSDSRVDYLKFGATTELDDILVLIRADESITATAVSLSSSSSSNSGGTISTHTVTYNIPQGSIIFSATNGYYCHKPEVCNNGSAAKIFKVSNTNIATIPAGTVSNNGTGNISLFSAPWALGVNDGSLLLSSSSSFTNVLKTTFETSVSKSELKNRGFVTENGILRFKIVHIPSGTGYANVDNITCGATCDLSSSSSGI